jgi:predicted transcriptional regulator
MTGLLNYFPVLRVPPPDGATSPTGNFWKGQTAMAEQDAPGVSQEMLLSMVAEIVSSYVRSNKIATSQLPEIIHQVYRSLERPEPPAPKRQEPAVPIRRSITPEFLICLEDGRKLKMLKRYLATTYDLTPQQYREKWGLPKDYPMVAPNYALRRSSLAKESGLGRRQPLASPGDTARASPPPRATGRRRGPKPKATS